MVEIDTDVVRPSDKRTRGQNRLYQPTATLSIYKNSFFPRTTRMESSSYQGHWCCHYGGVQSRSRTCLADPSAVILLSTACFNCTNGDFNFGMSWLSLSPLTGQQYILVEESWPLHGRRRRRRRRRRKRWRRKKEERKFAFHYKNMPIQIYWKFNHQKLKIFR